MIKKTLLLLIFVLCFFCSSLAVPHQIKIKINGLSNKPVLLAHYFANKKTKYAVDTAILDSNGRGVFNNSRSLEQGIYLVILPDYQNFEFLLGEQQNLEIEASASPRLRDIKFINAPENIEFSIYKKKKKESDSTHMAALASKNKALIAKSGIKRTEYLAYRKSIQKKYASTFLEQLISSNIMEENLWKDSLDITVFNNPGLINTPYYEPKLFYYLDTLIPQGRDTMEKTISTLFNNTLMTGTIFRYLCDALQNHYRYKNNYEEIFLYIADNYYIPFVNWAEVEDMEKLQVAMAAIIINILLVVFIF